MILDKLRSLFAPPIFEGDESNTRAASVLNALLISLMIGLIIIGIVTRFERIFNYAISLMLTIAVWMIMRRGHVRIASIAIVVGLSALLAIIVPFTGGVRASTYGGYLLVVLLAGLLLGQWAAIAVAFFASFLGAVLLAAKALGLWKTQASTASDMTFWIVFTVYFFVSAIVLMLALRLIEENFHKTQYELAERIHAEAELSSATEKLNRQVYELSTLYSVAMETADAQDENSLLNRVVEIIYTTLYPDQFGVLLWDAASNRLRRHASGRGAPLEFMNSSFALGEGIVGSVMASGQSRRISDVNLSPDYIAGRKEIQSELCVPIKIGEHVLGVINVESFKLNAFSESDERLLTTIAGQLAIAIENTRLVTNLQKELTNRKQAEEKIQMSSNQLAMANEIGRAISKLSDIKVTIQTIFEQISKIVELDVFFIALYDASQNIVSYPIMYDSGQFWDEEPTELSDTSWTAQVIHQRRSILKNRTDEEISNINFIKVLGSKKVSASAMTVPMIIGDKILGVVAIHSYKLNAYTDEHLKLLEGVTLQVTIAIENARLYANLQQELAERKRTEAELEKRNNELERFNYTLSHELKTPLITLGLFSGALEKDIESGNKDRIKTDLNRIVKASDKMHKIANELLELSNLDRQSFVFKETPFEVVVREGLRPILDLTKERKVQIHLEPNLPRVQLDIKYMTEVIQHLANNAIKYMGNQSEPLITIGFKNVNDALVFFVKDNGIGIDPQYVTRIFNLFEKLDPQSEGTGIGLALVKRIIEGHGGMVWAESEGIGKGSTFCFTLPELPT